MLVDFEYMPGDLRLIEFQRMSRQSWQDMMEDIHPMSPNIHVAQQNTTGWTDVLQHMFCYDTHSAPGCLASASLPCEKMTALYYHANRCLSGMHPDAMRRQAAKRRSKGARRKDREAGCREATVEAEQPPHAHAGLSTLRVYENLVERWELRKRE